ncbi:hypothetical protein [Negadavirga shengliensis]|uniref:HEPN domain-containing protein n=1 Tax=Negadavirga shengliensis TaxID=1389218 RepID=A0ABV9SX48_9BACT
MKDIKPQKTLDEAEELFDLAKEELCRPEEDVVHYMVCSNSYKAISKYLAGFLMKNILKNQTSLSIEDLLRQCREVDPEFKKLDLAPLTHQKNPEDVWMNMDTAREFMMLAEKTRALVNAM